MKFTTTSFAAQFAFLCGVTTALFVGASVAAAQTPGDLEVTAQGMTATATFVRSTPCTPYTLSWGDGTKEVVEATGDLCIQVVSTEALRHQYEAAGTYEVALTLGGEAHTAAVEVPVAVRQFSLDEVAGVTAEWVDPSPMMADEEYYVYTITLDDGEEVVLEVAGFTTEEWRVAQFREAGYVGDVEALIERAVPVAADEADDAPSHSAENADIYYQLIRTLETLVVKLAELLATRAS